MKITIERVKPKTSFFQLKVGDVFLLFDKQDKLFIKMPQIRTINILYNAFDLTLSEAVGVNDDILVIKMDDVRLTAKTKDKEV